MWDSFKNGSLILLLVLNWSLSSSLSSRHLSKWMPSGQLMASAGETLHCLFSQGFPLFCCFFLFSNLPMDCKGWSHFVLEAFSIFRLFLEALNLYTILKLYHKLLTISYLESEQKDWGVWWFPQELMLTWDPVVIQNGKEYFKERKHLDEILVAKREGTEGEAQGTCMHQAKNCPTGLIGGWWEPGDSQFNLNLHCDFITGSLIYKRSQEVQWTSPSLQWLMVILTVPVRNYCWKT